MLAVSTYIEAAVELATASVEDGAYITCLFWKHTGENGQARDCDHGKVVGMAKALGSAESDAHSGKGAGAMNHSDSIEFTEANTTFVGEGADSWDDAFGCGTAGKGCAVNPGGRVGGIRQGQTAGGAACIDEKYLHMCASSCGN